MKKFISLLLALSVIFSLPTAVFAEPNVNRDAAIDALDMLQTLGIVQEEYNANNINADQKITRAEFAVYFAKLLNIQPATGGTLYYNDVPKSYYAFGEITALTEQGYLSGVEDKKFSPDEVILKEHATYAILKAMGYGTLLGYNSGLKDALRRTELDEGVSANIDLVFGDLVLLMKNALAANCFDVTAIGSDGNNFEEGRTLLYNTRRMDYVKDVRVTGANSASINGNNVYGDSAEIGGEMYKTEKNLTDYLGFRVNVVYYQKDDSADKEVVWIEKLNTSDEISITVDEYAEYNSTNSTLTYYDKNDKQKTVVIPQGISVVYNGGFIAENINEIFSADRYDLTLINTDGKAGYDVAVVWRYENRFVNSVDKSTMIMYDRITQDGFSIYEDDYDFFEFVTSAGEKIAPTEVAPKSVVSTYVSKDGKFLKAVVATETVDGVYNGQNQKDGISVDGKFYKFYNTTADNDYSGAKKLKLYLDYNGYIAYAESNYSTDNLTVAYVYKGYCEDRGLSKAIALKVFDEDGMLDQYLIEGSVYVDETKYNDVETAYSKIAKNDDGSLKPQIMGFVKDENGKIEKIHLTDDNGGTGKTIMKNGEQPTTGTNHFKETMNIIGMNMLVNSGTKVFYVPKDDQLADAKERNFSIQTPADAEDFSGAVSYKVTPDEVFYEQYIIRKGDVSATSFSLYKGFFVVEDVIETINSEGDIVKALKGMQMGQDLTLEIDPDVFDFYADEKLQNVKSGDILRVAHKDNILGNASLIYSYGQTEPVAVNRDDAVNPARFISGYVHSKEDNVFKLDFEKDGKWDQIADMTSYAANIMVYDSKAREKKVYKGTLDDMKTAVDSGDGSFVVMHTYYMRCWGLVIYK